MGRRKKAPVEGLVVNLDLSFTGKFIIEDHIVTPLPPPPPPKKEKVKKESTHPPPSSKPKKSIDDILEHTRECDDCKSVLFHWEVWKDKKLCVSCHQPYVDVLVDQFQEYISTECNKQCAFCNKGYKILRRFHFDHINMFSKREGVGAMLMRGEDIEKIKEEANKCQLLCYSCHSVVTRIEQRLGFMTEKRRLKKAGKNDDDILNDLFNNYDEVMSPIYEKIKEIVRRSG
jgi:hypothetical protein